MRASGPDRPSTAPNMISTLICLSLAAPCPSFETEGPERFGPAVEAARAILAEARRATGAPGLSAAVLVDGELVWTEAIGFSDAEARTAISPSTRFRIGTVGHLFTAATALRLVEQEKLELDGSIHDLVPQFHETADRLTPRHLLGHLGGIRHFGRKDFEGGRDISEKHYASVGAVLDLFRFERPRALPGAIYRFSSPGFVLLAVACERAAERDFFELMEAEILEPLGLDETCREDVSQLPRDTSRFYVRAPGGEIAEAPHQDPSFQWGSGGLLSTARDLARFGGAHLDGTLLSKPLMEEAFTEQVSIKGKVSPVGLGWFAGVDDQGRRLASHNGNQPGARAMLAVWPNERVSVALLSNLHRTPLLVDSVALALARPFLETIEGADASAPTVDPVGEWKLRIAGEEDGRLTITRGAEGALSGAIATPAAIAQIHMIEKLEPRELLEVIDLRVRGQRVEGTILSPVGLFPLRLTVSGDSLEGDFGTVKVCLTERTELTGERAP